MSDSAAPNATLNLKDRAGLLQRLWDEGQGPDLAAFVAQGGPLPDEELAMLLRIDQRGRWRAGTPLSTEEYLLKFPAVAAVPEHVVDLIFNEFLLRESLGQRPTSEEYLARFPAHADTLRQQLDLHHAMNEPGQTLVGQTLPSRTLRMARSATYPEGLPDLPRLGKYATTARLGSGAMGVVYRATDDDTQREVAIKVMNVEIAASPKARQRFLREARTTARIRSDYVVRVYDAGEDPGTRQPFIVMELLEGESLHDRLNRTKNQPAPLPVILQIAKDVARGLAAAHAQGLTHRDVKPTNVWLEPVTDPGEAPGQFRCKLLDFGLAAAPAEIETGLTSVGGFIGTPLYAPLEQFDGVADHSSDLFSLGVILYLMATGGMPFPGKKLRDIRHRLETTTPQDPREMNPRISQALSDLILSLLAREQANRPPNAAAVVEAILKITQEIKAEEAAGAAPDQNLVKASPASETRSALEEPRKSRKALIIAGAASVVLGIAALVVLLSRKPADQNRGKDNSTDAGQNSTRNEKAPNASVAAAGFDQAAERRGAVWLLENSGEIEVADSGNQTIRTVAKIADLPAAFRVAKFTVENRSEGINDSFKSHLSRLTAVSEVKLQYCVHLNDDGLGVIARLPELSVLRLEVIPKVGDEGIKLLSTHPTLKELYMVGVPITAADVARLYRIPKLEVFQSYSNKVTDGWLNGIGSAKKLTQLYFEHNHGTGTITADGLANLRGLNQLYLLSFDSSRIQPGAIRALPPLPALDQLYLRRSGATDVDLENLDRFPNLQTLGLHDLSVTKAGMESVAKCPSLTSLNLDGTQIGDEGLAALHECKTLRKVSLYGTNCTMKSVEKLRMALPECTVKMTQGDQ